MKEHPSSAKASRCVVCGAAELQPVVRQEHFDIENGKRKVAVQAENVPVEVCPACGETYSGPEAGRIRDEAICRTLGLLTASEVRGARERMGLTVNEHARLT